MSSSHYEFLFQALVMTMLANGIHAASFMGGERERERKNFPGIFWILKVNSTNLEKNEIGNEIFSLKL